MKNASKLLFASFLFSHFLYAGTADQSLVEMQKKELSLMKDGYTYVEPTDSQKKNGVVSIYQKSDCSKGNECGIKNIPESNYDKWSKSNATVPNVHGKKNSSTRLTGYDRIEMQNETINNICVKYIVSISAENTSASNTSTLWGCMKGNAHFLANHEVFVYAQLQTGKYRIENLADIYDVPFINSSAYGTAYID